MAIYGTGLLAICLLTGILVGRVLGMLIGVEANVGGVGIAMLLLIVAAGRLQHAGRMPQPTRSGVLFWSSIYIPIVVAMAASQNVRAAVTGGPAAMVAGVAVVAVCFGMVPLICRLGSADGGDSSSFDVEKNPSTRESE